jgi:hypothetical protein
VLLAAEQRMTRFMDLGKRRPSNRPQRVDRVAGAQLTDPYSMMPMGVRPAGLPGGTSRDRQD